MKNSLILIKNGFVEVSGVVPKDEFTITSDLATISNNMFYYGYMPSKELLSSMSLLDKDSLISVWNTLEENLKEVTFSNRDMNKYVVYKNFPKEVLDMDFNHYWVNQIMIYWGYGKHIASEANNQRIPMNEMHSKKVLHLANENTLQDIFNGLISSPVKWTEEEYIIVKHLFSQVENKELDITAAKFKVNIISLSKDLLEESFDNLSLIKIGNATDVARLLVALSGGDISLRKEVFFKNFKRNERLALMSLLDNFNNIMDDIALRPIVFKKLFQKLHPGDYKQFSNVISAYNNLYNGKYSSFNSKKMNLISNKDEEALSLLASRPGEFLRDLHFAYNSYGLPAFEKFATIVDDLSIIQLLKIEKYLNTINDRKTTIAAPKSNWSKLKIINNEKVKIHQEHLDFINNVIHQSINTRLKDAIPNGVLLDEKTKEIKLKSNDQEVALYGRGTSFDIPDNITYLRSASYWQKVTNGSNWFDNSWNFFDKNMNPISACCWNKYAASFKDENYSVFSGDPANAYDKKGIGCQVIDVYLDKLKNAGVAYAAWSILSYNGIVFNETEEVLGVLQMGEKPQEGEIIEPSRASLSLDLSHGKGLVKYVALIDVENRKIIYLDSILPSHVSSAERNGNILKEYIPALLENINAIPSIYDLFKHADKGSMPVYYSDKDISIKQEHIVNDEDGSTTTITHDAYIFKKENSDNVFNNILLEDLLNLKVKKPSNKFKM